jgi:hypothetical protein
MEYMTKCLSRKTGIHPDDNWPDGMEWCLRKMYHDNWNSMKGYSKTLVDIAQTQCKPRP